MPMTARTAAGVATVALAALAGCATTLPKGPATPVASADEYIQEARSHVMLRTPPGSRPTFSGLVRHDFDDLITVCGSVHLQPQESLRFAAIWKRHEGPDKAFVMAPIVNGETPRTQPWLASVSETTDEFCKVARKRSGKVAPPSSVPPNITPEQYIETSKAEILRQIAGLPGARIMTAAHAKDARHAVVCGQAFVKGQTLPFSTIWAADAPLDTGASSIAVLGGKTPADQPKFAIFSTTVRSLCASFKLHP